MFSQHVMRSRAARSAVTVAMLALVASCSDASGPVGTDDASADLSKSRTSTSSQTVVTFDSTQLAATHTTHAYAKLVDRSGNTVSRAVTEWWSSNTGIATVSTDGTINTKNTGTIQIFARINGVAGFSSLVVTTAPAPAKVATVSVKIDSSSLVITHQAQATATVLDAKGNVLTGRAITWSSSNTGAATVSSTGAATAVAAGSANIVAKVDSVTGSAPLTVVAVPTGLVVAQQPGAGAAGASLTTQPVIQIRDASKQLVTTAMVVTASIASGTGSLVGTTSVTSVNGVATFSNLGVNTAGTFSLRFATSAPALNATSNSFTVNAAAPLAPASITSLSRDGGSSAGGARVRVTGSGFVSGDVVQFNGVNAKSTTFVDAAHLDAIAPAGTATNLMAPTAVSVSIVRSGATAATRANAWTYWPAPTNTLAAADFENGTYGTGGLAPCCKPAGGDAISISTEQANSGTHSVKQVAMRTDINDVAFGGGWAQDDILRSPGRWHRYYMYLPAATLASVANNGQIKLFLSRTGPGTDGTQHFVVLGTGPETRNPGLEGVNALGANADQFNYHLNGVADPKIGNTATPIITPNVWHEIQIWEYRDPSAHRGYARIWWDGKLIADTQTATGLDPKVPGLLGDDLVGKMRGAQFGLVYTQNAKTYPLVIYLDDVTVANGYVDPPGK